ncbi:MAG: acetate--CoA ligase family protein [Chloroflexi bacterium]|nr:acetate--CoA ligase family protein [Chloroflexota bacterium]MCI0783629.1 acetate--CoA ligase family protein [Chloroflexota bacterium]MCI0813552.1 acetate--CoA ligase family protein [Chloroflexota bacterium]MCI0817531.1 acetate--CoA ligase family protein [Chloroflexota bacterium]MCI0818690.1 acetate--CoA ligase family protein [Chloroflexota bacterium]
MVTLSEAIERARSEDRSVLTEIESKQVLAAAGIPVAEATLAASADDAAKAAAKAGFPVVLKIVSPDVTHKSDVGGVKIGLEDEAAVRTAYDDIIAAVSDRQPKARIEGVAVQAMARPGTEVIVGMSKDPQFGPVLMFGLGGIFVEVLKDVSFRIVPLEERDAREMIDEIKGRAVLDGVRGGEPADIGALASLLLQLSAFAEANPQVEELDLNPVFAYKDGCLAVDARIVVSAES